MDVDEKDTSWSRKNPRYAAFKFCVFNMELYRLFEQRELSATVCSVLFSRRRLTEEPDFRTKHLIRANELLAPRFRRAEFCVSQGLPNWLKWSFMDEASDALRWSDDDVAPKQKEILERLGVKKGKGASPPWHLWDNFEYDFFVAETYLRFYLQPAVDNRTKAFERTVEFLEETVEFLEEEDRPRFYPPGKTSIEQSLKKARAWDNFYSHLTPRRWSLIYDWLFSLERNLKRRERNLRQREVNFKSRKINLKNREFNLKRREHKLKRRERNLKRRERNLKRRASL